MKDMSFKVKYFRSDKGALALFVHHKGKLLMDAIVCDDDTVVITEHYGDVVLTKNAGINKNI